MKEPRFIYKDVPTDEEFIGMMKEINQRPCVLDDEPRIEYSGKMKLDDKKAGQGIATVLLNNGYTVKIEYTDYDGQSDRYNGCIIEFERAVLFR